MVPLGVVGQLLVIGIPGTSLAQDVAAHVRALRPGGFIAFARNFESPEQFRRLVGQLDDAAGRPLLVMVDHEGGRVVRFQTGVTPFPDALTVGANHEPEAAYRQGQTEAHELRALGVHLNLAPCIDVLVEGADPVIGTRSYGSDPKRVAAFGAARIRGLQEHGVAACAKHFPGIGAVPNDPHKELPVVALEWDAMRQAHLTPFVEAVKAGVATIMSSHVCYPRLLGSSEEPATFSTRLMREMLRGELGFDGVTLSDDLEMGALRRLCNIGEAAVRAVDAGHDLVLVCSDLAAQRRVAEALQHAYQHGRLSTVELERRLARLARLRNQSGVRS